MSFGPGHRTAEDDGSARRRHGVIDHAGLGWAARELGAKRAVERRVHRFTPLLLLALLVVGHCAAEDTDRGWLHLNGYTYHLNARHCNSFLYGSGVTWYTHDTERLHTAWEADLFADSARKPSAYAGYSVGLPFHGVTFAGTAAIMYHRNFIAQNRYRILPVVLPFLEFGGRKLRVRVYYVPPVRRASDEQVAAQVMIPLWE